MAELNLHAEEDSFFCDEEIGKNSLEILTCIYKLVACTGSRNY